MEKNIILLAFKDFFVCVVMLIGTHYWRWDKNLETQE